MAEITDYIGIVGLAGAVSGHTGDHMDGAKAGGYSAWVQSVTGEMPYVKRLPGNRVKLVLSESQVKKLQTFLDTQVSGMLNRREPGAVDYGLTPVVKPWALRYALPAGLGILVAGFIAGKLV